MKCVICGKKACVGFGSCPETETLGLCKEHMTEVNIWRLQRMMDVKRTQAAENERTRQQPKVPSHS